MKVILIEDDMIIGDMIKMYLAEEGNIVYRVDTGTGGLALIEEKQPDLVIIDLVLPDLNGIEVCREIRKESVVPIVIISMNTEVMSRVEALNAGADDYLCKPFSMKELLARMNAILRRAYQRSNYKEADGSHSISRPEDKSIVIEHEYRSIKVQGKIVETTFTEFEIMKLLYNHPERVFSREELIIYLRGIHTLVNERSIDVHVMKLRNKIELDPKNPKYIKTVWGIGYKFSLNKFNKYEEKT
ncbi:response regulator transcription factor [Paenibacillus sp. FSL H8-0259]|uniref:response regulator transcription factor n=1 Tax=Paenibacillus sp. FSL H8-0259 TaxID=1920423 RepID=UPI00096F693A|nr:response regulator transcription factor [Paenibacillus sp. FSL H8-0259]OMF33317.1 DNA-binding response regulator [Paenibacillus sp. FSL H8-0259]